MIAVAGIITTVVVSARKAIVSGAQVTSELGKAVTKLGSLSGPLLNVVARSFCWVPKVSAGWHLIYGFRLLLLLGLFMITTRKEGNNW